ncbi:hypothetical protein LTR85_007303 [Meristemomyces frigidus]|nr:hypothetical protein LTR85_007303 [Meristemomyces frigidus]
MSSAATEQQRKLEEERTFWAYYRTKASQHNLSSEDLLKAKYWLAIDRGRARDKVKRARRPATPSLPAMAGNGSHPNDVEALQGGFGDMRLEDYAWVPKVDKAGSSAPRLTRLDISADFDRLPPDPPMVWDTQPVSQPNKPLLGRAVISPAKVQGALRTTGQPMPWAQKNVLQTGPMLPPVLYAPAPVASSNRIGASVGKRPSTLNNMSWLHEGSALMTMEPLSRQVARKGGDHKPVGTSLNAQFGRIGASAAHPPLPPVKMKSPLGRSASFAAAFLGESDDEEGWEAVASPTRKPGAARAQYGDFDDSDSDDEEHYQTARRVVRHSPKAKAPPPISAARFAEKLLEAGSSAGSGDVQQHQINTDSRAPIGLPYVSPGNTLRAAVDFGGQKVGDKGVKKGDAIEVLGIAPTDAAGNGRFVGKVLWSGVVDVFPNSE